LEAKLSYTDSLLADHFLRVKLSHRYRKVTTQMNVEGVIKELGERGEHREGVVGKARRLLSIEA
jgi:hypothetical protein